MAKTLDNIQEIEDEIRAILNQHSGGVKFLTLVSHLTLSALQKNNFVITPLDIESIIHNMDGVKILQYTWDMGTNYRRHKMFVYTP